MGLWKDRLLDDDDDDDDDYGGGGDILIFVFLETGYKQTGGRL
jgi:hypothetical protein